MRYADARCVYEEKWVGGKHVYVFTGPCVVTGESVSVTVPAEELRAYRRGELIQDAMPSLTDGEREFLMTGISDVGWGQTFKEFDCDPDELEDDWGDL